MGKRVKNAAGRREKEKIRLLEVSETDLGGKIEMGWDPFLVFL